MKIGLSSPNSDYGLGPAEMARELEQRGYESLWVGEHTNIPASRNSAHPSGGEMPPHYWHARDPFVSLAAAAVATTNLKLVTGVCLVLEHGVLDLAKSVATLDQLAGGRLLFGVGVGWNREEHENVSSVPWSKRYTAMRETVEAMRGVWANDVSGYDGEFVRFTPLRAYPKPTKPSGPPVLMGCQGKIGLRHLAEYADEWCPRDARFADLTQGFQDFREAVLAAGRDPDTIPVSMFCFGDPSAEKIETYAKMGVERVVFFAPDTPGKHQAFLDRYQPLVDEFGAR